MSFEILDWHFPAFMVLAGKTIHVKKGQLALKTAAREDLSKVWFPVDGLLAVKSQDFVTGLGGLPTMNIGAGFTSAVGKHTLMVKAAGSLRR